MANKPTLYFEKGKSYEVELSFDGFLEGTGANGKPYTLCAVKYNNQEYSFFVNDYGLRDKLKQFSKGNVVKITDKDTSDDKFSNDFEVVSVGSSKPLEEIMKPNNTEIKIGVYASMKIASAFSANIDELKVNTLSVIDLHRDICNSIKNEEESLID